MRITPRRTGAGGHQVPTQAGGALAILLLASACWYPKEMGARLEQRVNRIETTSAARQPEENAAASQELARRLDLRISVLQKQVDTLNASSSTSQQAGAERTTRLEALGEEIRRLRAALEQHGQRLDAIERSLAQPRQVVRERPPKSAARPAATPPPPPAAPEGDVLAVAREQEAKGEKAVARSLYEEFLEKYPQDPGAPEARYRLGELAYGERRYKDAVVQYGKVAEDFPRSDRAPDALLKTAESMLAMDLREDATTLLNEVQKRYPGTPAAGRARQRLAELAKSGPGSAPR